MTDTSPVAVLARPRNVKIAGGTDVSHENPHLLNDLYELAALRPTQQFVVTSGDRTHQPLAPTFGIAAPEGLSNHELYAYGKGPYDEAIDVTVDGHPIAEVLSALDLAAVGVWNSVAGDPVHVVPIGVHG